MDVSCLAFQANIQLMALNIRGFMRVRGFSMDLTLTPPRYFFIASSAIWGMILWKLWCCSLADWWVEALDRSLFSSFCCRETCIHVLNVLHCTHTSARVAASLFCFLLLLPRDLPLSHRVCSLLVCWWSESCVANWGLPLGIRHGVSVEAICTGAVDSLLLHLLGGGCYTTCNCASPFHASARQSSCEQAMAAVTSANDMLKSFVRWFARAARLSIA